MGLVLKAARLPPENAKARTRAGFGEIPGAGKRSRTPTVCAELFRAPQGYAHLFQIRFSKGNVGADGYPMDRAFLYDGAQ